MGWYDLIREIQFTSNLLYAPISYHDEERMLIYNTLLDSYKTRPITFSLNTEPWEISRSSDWIICGPMKMLICGGYKNEVLSKSFDIFDLNWKSQYGD
jgi:hypothetical protein